MKSLEYDEERHEWVEETSALEFLNGDPCEVFHGQWGRAGAVRGGCAKPRSPAHVVSGDGERLWPTPAASTPNDGEAPAHWLARFVKHASGGAGATRAGVPLAVAARAPVVLRVARVGSLEAARELLARHAKSSVPELASEDTLNPAWVEMLMGFPSEWTDVPLE